MVKYSFDSQLKKTMTDAIREKSKYTAFVRGVITVSGIDLATGDHVEHSMSINGEFRHGFLNDQGTRRWPRRFDGEIAEEGTDTLKNGCMVIEFPVCEQWNGKQMARALAMNVGIACGLML